MAGAQRNSAVAVGEEESVALYYQSVRCKSMCLSAALFLCFRRTYAHFQSSHPSFRKDDGDEEAGRLFIEMIRGGGDKNWKSVPILL